MRRLFRGIRFALKALFLLVVAVFSVLAFLAIDASGESVC
jgi:hypothetical protein